MELWKIAVLIVMVVLIAWIYKLNQDVETLRKLGGSKEEIQKKNAQLKVLTRVIIVFFLLILGYTMIQHYGKIGAMRAK